MVTSKYSPRLLSLRLLKEMLQHLGWRVWAVFGLMVVFGAASLLPSILFRYFALGLTNPDAQSFLLNLAIFGFLIAVAFFISAFGGTLCREWLGIKAEGFLRKRVLNQIHFLPLDALDNAHRGDWMTSMSRDLFSVEMFLMDTLPSQIRESSVVIVTAVLFFYFSGFMGALPLLTALLLALSNLKVQRRLSPYLHELRTLRGTLFQVMIESLEGIRTVRSQQAERAIEARFEGKMKETQVKTLRVARQIGFLSGGTEFFTKLLILVCLYADAWLFTHGRLTLEEAFIYPFFTGLFYDSVCRLADRLYDLNRFFTEASRVAEILYHPRLAPGFEPAHQAPDGLNHLHSLSLTNVHLKSGKESLIQPFDFQFEKGAIWAVVGPSGSGKSTFLETLSGLRSAEGLGVKAYAEKASTPLDFRVNAKQMGLPVQLSAYVEQHPYLFEGTLKENLLLGLKNAISDAELNLSLDSLGLVTLFSRRQGLASPILEKGKNLSIGEKYRVALCRSLLLKRPFLLLDEPFAALDEESARKVVECLNILKKTTGITLVTHFIPKNLQIDHLLTFERGHAHFSKLPAKNLIFRNDEDARPFLNG